MSLGMKIWEKLFVGKSTAWTALFTCALVVVTILLFSIHRMTNQISMITQRAFINFLGIEGMKVVDDQSKKVIALQFLVAWGNSGTTPTKNAVGQCNIQLWPAELPKGFAFGDLAKLEKRPLVIGPKATVRAPLLVSIDVLNHVRQKKSHLYVWGWITYHDIFSGTPTRLTEFCSEIINVTPTKPDMTDPSCEINWQIVSCPEHNCYDEDCPDYQTRIK